VAFWAAAWHGIRRGQIEPVFGMGFVAWHLIQFTEEALKGQQNASFYAAKQYPKALRRKPSSSLST
jgi:hopanoid C-2 methylase